jgi:glycosyltransferase involved in cell wall biosynthesis
MRLGINGFFWGQEITGSGQYTRQLVHGLMTIPDGPECLLFRPKSREVEKDTVALGGKMQERFLSPPLPLTENLSKLWFEQISFPRACLGQGVDVAHIPYFASPLQAGSRTVVTIHDLIPLILPAYRGSILVRLYTQLVVAAARRATAIMTDSHSSKKDITELLGIPPDRVHVIHLAAREMFKPVRDSERLNMTRQKYGLQGEYILYLGGFDRRKNLKTLLAAFASMDDSLRARAHLVIGGHLPQENTPFFPDPRVIVERLGLQGRVSFVGSVPEKEKPALYSGATLFVFPSLYEGFGLPPLEAMACGTAVIASDRSSLPEIGGEGALLVDPDDVHGLARAMTSLMEDERRRRELAAKGLKQAQRFSWQKTVAETMAVYRSVAASY